MRPKNISDDNTGIQDVIIHAIKYYNKKNLTFNAIKSEGNSLIFMNKKFPNLFPTVRLLTNDVLIMSVIDHNNIRSNDYQKILA